MSVLALTLIIGSVKFASADPYTSVDDPGTPEAKHYELDLFTVTNQVIGAESQQPLIDSHMV